MHLPYHSVWRKKVFWTWLEEKFISSDMRGDILLLILLWYSDDRGLPLVEKICNSMGFLGRKLPSNRQGSDRHLFFCAAFTLYYEEGQNSQKTN